MPLILRLNTETKSKGDNSDRDCHGTPDDGESIVMGHEMMESIVVGHWESGVDGTGEGRKHRALPVNE